MTEFDSVDQMKPELWTSSANSVIKLSLVDDNGAIKFSPLWTYPIFGDSEQIFGYKNLIVNLAFDSVTFKPFLTVKFASKLNCDVENVQQKLLDFLPPKDVIIDDEIVWVDAFHEEQQSYCLPAEKYIIDSYECGGDEFAVYQCKLSDNRIRTLHRRMQIFTLFFIESASYIDETDDMWTLFITFNKRTKQCIGYATTYKYWRYPGAKDFDNNTMYQYTAKISQFLIYPPYQGKSHGSLLYNSIVNQWQRDPAIAEIIVEDPNESFDILRDKNDLSRLYQDGLFDKIPNQVPLSDSWILSVKKKYKLETRQLMRLIEMIMMHNQHPNLRLQIKKRLYEKNFDLLADLDNSTRNDKLQTAFLSIRDEYKNILSSLPLVKRGFDGLSDSSIVKRTKLD